MMNIKSHNANSGLRSNLQAVANVVSIVSGLIVIGGILFVMIEIERIQVVTASAANRVVQRVMANSTHPIIAEHRSNHDVGERSLAAALTLLDAIIKFGPDGIVSLLQNATTALHSVGNFNTTALSDVMASVTPHVDGLARDANAAGMLMELVFNATGK